MSPDPHQSMLLITFHRCEMKCQNRTVLVAGYAPPIFEDEEQLENLKCRRYKTAKHSKKGSVGSNRCISNKINSHGVAKSNNFVHNVAINSNQFVLFFFFKSAKTFQEPIRFSNKVNIYFAHTDLYLCPPSTHT